MRWVCRSARTSRPSKCLDVARRQRDAGACGITVSTLKEAEEFFDGGFDDIFYAVAITPTKVERALALQGRDCKLRLLVDSLAGAQTLLAAAVYGPREARPTKLDAFNAYVGETIEAGKPHWIPAVVLLPEIQALGYDGGLTQLKMFINPLKQVVAEPVVRFETAPGEQMHADFTVIRRGRALPLLQVQHPHRQRDRLLPERQPADAKARCHGAQFSGGSRL